MSTTNRLLRLALLASGMTLLLPREAAAQYLDPGSGSLIVQIIIAGVIGLGAVTRLYWTKIKSVAVRLSAKLRG